MKKASTKTKLRAPKRAAIRTNLVLETPIEVPIPGVSPIEAAPDRKKASRAGTGKCSLHLPSGRRGAQKNEHHFLLVVKTNSSRKCAETSVLSSFATRQPDGCEFFLKPVAGYKDAWMAGAQAGAEFVFELITRDLKGVGARLKIKMPIAVRRGQKVSNA